MKDRIKLLMEDQHLTQQSFAQALGVAPATLCNIFNGKTKPTMNTVEAIHNKFPQVNPVWILFGTPPMYINNEEASLGREDDVSEASASHRPSVSQPAMESLSLKFDDDDELSSSPADKRSKPTQPVQQGSLFNQQQVHGVGGTPKNATQDGAKYLDKRQRKITEIRIFYDDQTWETFVPKK